ncbi:hypothetical protein N665_0928s0002 [Sinapis alba]|nr:hypothetical protein N665_0928s0002 [Sinapis alba]
MYVVRLSILMILLFFASSNTVLSRLTIDYRSPNTKIGDRVWDKKFISEIKSRVDRSVSLPAKGRIHPGPGNHI